MTNNKQPSELRSFGAPGFRQGFTLIEMILAIALGSLLVVMIASIATSGFKVVSAMSRRANLHSNAIFLTDTLSYWVRQGILLQAPNASTLKIILAGVPATSSTILLSGSRVFANGVPVTTSDVSVKSLTFATTTTGHSVRVSFTIQALNEPDVLSATTTFAERNPL